MPIEFEELDALAETVIEGVTPSGVLFVDASFERAVVRSYQVLDSFVGALLSQSPILAGECKIVVAIDELPLPVDQIYDLLAEPELASRLAIVCESGHNLGLDSLASMIGPALREYPIKRDPIEFEMLRRRGVFRGREGMRETFYSYYYELSDSGVNTFRQRLVEAVSNARSDVLVFDAVNAGPWFRSLVQSACVDLHVERGQSIASAESVDLVALRNGQLGKPRVAGAVAVERALARQDASVAVIVPAFTAGRTAARVLESIGRPDGRNCILFTVFVDDRLATEQSPLEGMKASVVWNHGRATLRIHFLHQVPVRSLLSTQWLVKAAELLGEVRDFPAVRIRDERLPRTTVWSMLEDCGVRAEDLPPGNRTPVRHYPNLSMMSPWDAHLLAELAIQQVLRDEPQSNRNTMLFVIPDEANGTDRIAQALQERCRIAVARVPRAVIEGTDELEKEVRDKIHRHRSNTIVVFDETSVSVVTLRRLAELVGSVTNLEVSLIGCVFDLSIYSLAVPGPRVFSLERWVALAEVSA